MAGGQAIDLEAEGRKLAIGQVEEMHSLKTGALIRASVMMGAACAPALEPRLEQALAGFAAPIGLAFQIQDDLLDVLSDTATLGKAAGADRERGKPTYPAILGVSASQEQVSRLHAQAMESLAPFGARARCTARRDGLAAGQAQLTGGQTPWNPIPACPTRLIRTRSCRTSRALSR